MNRESLAWLHELELLRWAKNRRSKTDRSLNAVAHGDPSENIRAMIRLKEALMLDGVEFRSNLTVRRPDLAIASQFRKDSRGGKASPQSCNQ
jgi:hypothetical protein